MGNFLTIAAKALERNFLETLQARQGRQKAFAYIVAGGLQAVHQGCGQAFTMKWSFAQLAIERKYETVLVAHYAVGEFVYLAWVRFEIDEHDPILVDQYVACKGLAKIAAALMHIIER